MMKTLDIHALDHQGRQHDNRRFWQGDRRVIASKFSFLAGYIKAFPSGMRNLHFNSVILIEQSIIRV